MKLGFAIVIAFFTCLTNISEAKSLSSAEIIEKLDANRYTFEPTAMAEWSGLWEFNLSKKQSYISSMPKGGNATYSTVVKNDQICNVSGVPNLHASHGLSGCFNVRSKGKSIYLYKGKRRIFSLRLKGVVR